MESQNALLVLCLSFWPLEINLYTAVDIESFDNQ